MHLAHRHFPWNHIGNHLALLLFYQLTGTGQANELRSLEAEDLLFVDKILEVLLIFFNVAALPRP